MYLTSFLLIYLFHKQEPTHHMVSSKPHLAPKRFLRRVGPTSSNSRRIAWRWLFTYLSNLKHLCTMF
jgi:hypothetical protein